MSIITNFLKLIKPEKNDYVDVEEHISNNYDKIDTWARDLVINDLENGGVDKALSANQGLILDNKDVGIMGGRDGKFPLTAATKGNIYLLESTQKYYICINDYDGIQISVPNANFEELSVYTNRSKLDNLSESYYSDIDFQNGKIYFQKIGKLIMCTSMIQLTEPLNSGITNVGTVPEGFRPPKTVEIAVFGSAVERQADILGNIDIQSNGSMRLFSSQTFTSVAFRITACWFI